MSGIERHIKKRKSFDVLGQSHEITFSCYKRLSLFTEPWEYQVLFESLDQARASIGFELWAYAAMPSHVHLLLRPTKETSTIARILHAIKRPTSQRIIERWLAESNPKLDLVDKGEGKSRSFWMPGGGYDRNLTSDKTIEASIEYIHGNPGKKGLVQADVEWPWSSAGAYAGIETGVLTVDPCPYR